MLALVETDGLGIAVIDLTRIRGGEQHWRICRGCGETFVTAGELTTAREGTLAGSPIARGALEDLPHPDYSSLAYMDEVETLSAVPDWRGSWPLDPSADAHLDLHQR